MSGTAHEQPRAVPGFGFAPPTAAALNHVLKSASWARARLQPFAGKIARLEIVPFRITLAILESGEVANATADAVPDATFTLTPGVALRMLAADPDAWQKVIVAGDTALAREILYIAQNLRWDVEEDLSRVVGDVAAHRMVKTAVELRRWQRDSAEGLARAAAAYWTEERPLVAGKQDVARFIREVDSLRDDVARLEKRIEQRLSKDAGR
jgi:ubiquinone biosynthesis protein UbiJ